jgi:hypothetical protein
MCFSISETRLQVASSPTSFSWNSWATSTIWPSKVGWVGGVLRRHHGRLPFTPTTITPAVFAQLKRANSPCKADNKTNPLQKFQLQIRYCPPTIAFQSQVSRSGRQLTPSSLKPPQLPCFSSKLNVPNVPRKLTTRPNYSWSFKFYY